MSKIQTTLLARIAILHCFVFAFAAQGATNAAVLPGSFAGYSYLPAKGPKGDQFNAEAGTTADRPPCTASLAGVERWNSTTKVLENCNGREWTSPILSVASGTTPSTYAASGFFVMTSATYDGNLGGYDGAHAKCYADLVANDWMGKADASSRGLLTAEKVRSFICIGHKCESPRPYAAYYYARSGNPAIGGEVLINDVYGNGPNDVFNWSTSTRFGISTSYWAYRRLSNMANNRWGWGTSIAAQSSEDSCNGWTSNASNRTSRVGATNFTDSRRFDNGTMSCNTMLPLICLVHP